MDPLGLRPALSNLQQLVHCEPINPVVWAPQCLTQPASQELERTGPRLGGSGFPPGDLEPRQTAPLRKLLLGQTGALTPLAQQTSAEQETERCVGHVIYFRN